MGRKAQAFVPLRAGKVGFYGCGPTVYNHAHIGNLRAYVLHDTLVRALRRGGFDVCHVMNITDVGHLSGDNDDGEDKMVKSAEERGKAVLEIAETYTGAFFADADSLNVLRPTVVCKATDHVPEMIALIRRIEENGFTYFAGGNLYFDTSRDPGYGRLALLRPEEGGERARTAADGNKRGPRDFVLWFTKSKFANRALVWDSPWGTGYPGWHIECSAMGMKYLGERFDIHAGGIDHVPVHHTNEIAQSEAATGKSPCVNYWIHNEFLVLDGEKMAKSSGDFLTLQKLVDAGYGPLDYRYFLLGGHYRSQLRFSWNALDGAKNARKSLLDRLRAVAAGASSSGAENRGGDGAAAKYLAAFDAAIRDDLNTPRALAELWGLLRDASVPAGAALETALDMDGALGLGLGDSLGPETESGGGLSKEETEEIDRIVAERTRAKKARDFARADELRRGLNDRGVVLEDGPDGTTWRTASASARGRL